MKRRWSLGLDLLTLGVIGYAALSLWAGPREGSGRPPSPVGRPAPRLHLTSGEGEPTRHDVANSLVFVFRSDCPVCATQQPNWRHLAGLGASLGFRTVAVTPEPLTRSIADYFEADPRIPVRQLVSFDALQELGVTQVPTTLVVDQAGLVRYRRAGVVRMSDSVLRTLR